MKPLLTSEPIDIAGLDKPLLALRLWEGALPETLGRAPRDNVWAAVHVFQALQQKREDFVPLVGTYIDYAFGRCLKVDLRGDTFDPRLYDRDHGTGCAARIVARLRQEVSSGQ